MIILALILLCILLHLILASVLGLEVWLGLVALAAGVMAYLVKGAKGYESKNSNY